MLPSLMLQFPIEITVIENEELFQIRENATIVRLTTNENIVCRSPADERFPIMCIRSRQRKTPEDLQAQSSIVDN